MTKKDTLKHWQGLAESMPIMPHFQPIPYKAEGSSYGACGIRIDGSPAFIDAVLSRLKDVLVGENAVTRLELSRQPVKAREGRPLLKAVTGAEVCYVRLHVRGGEGAMMESFLEGIHHKNGGGPTEQYAKAIGLAM